MPDELFAMTTTYINTLLENELNNTNATVDRVYPSPVDNVCWYKNMWPFIVAANLSLSTFEEMQTFIFGMPQQQIQNMMHDLMSQFGLPL